MQRRLATVWYASICHREKVQNSLDAHIEQGVITCQHETTKKICMCILLRVFVSLKRLKSIVIILVHRFAFIVLLS